jgi:hypothetical protein
VFANRKIPKLELPELVEKEVDSDITANTTAEKLPRPCSVKNNAIPKLDLTKVPENFSLLKVS